MSNNQDSTLKSTYENVTGAAQSMLGSVTGNTADQTAGADKRDTAAARDELSHTTAKVGPFAASGSGGVSKDDPKRQEGSWNQTVGSGKEFVGGLVGAEGMRQDGIEQNRKGQGQEAQGQLNDLGGGLKDRVHGAVGGATAGFTGNRDKEGYYDQMRADGKSQQRSAEHDIQKQNP